MSRPKLKVLTYNVMLLLEGLGDYDQEERSRNIAPALLNVPATEQADVIIFTEMFSSYSDNIIYALRPLYRYYTYRLGKECSGSQWDEYKGKCSNSVVVINGGVVIMSKYPITQKIQLVYNNSAFGSPDYFSNKGAAYVKIDKEGYTYHIVGTHMQADDGKKTYTDIREKQLQEIKGLVNSLNIPSNEPVIVGGDLNVPYTDDVTGKFIMNRLGGQYNYTLVPGQGSFSAVSNLYAQCLAEYMHYRPNYDNTLDYVVYLSDYLQPTNNPQMAVVHLKTQNPMYWEYMKKKLPDTGGNYNDPSDHYPVEVEYSYS
ncbi:sphingomyelin phosphodiesterase [Microcoleus sp. N9_A1]|uniref:sphingomyelin phosphodiesterase n=1 Tax=Microcoleus sp. N9_A1 TaxID=3055380 RepID=UPI002FD2F76B